MATLSELVKTVSEVEGVPLATVALIARNLREDGLIASKGRGLSAAKMTAVDATNLLIAVNASDVAGEATKTVREYRRLETVGSSAEQSPDFDAPRAQLGDALAELLSAVANRTLERIFWSLVPTQVSEAIKKNEAGIELVFYRPVPLAHLSIFAPASRTISVEGGLLPDEKLFRQLVNTATKIEFEFVAVGNAPKRHAKRRYGDRKDTTTISFSTIQAVAKTLSGR